MATTPIRASVRDIGAKAPYKHKGYPFSSTDPCSRTGLMRHVSIRHRRGHHEWEITGPPEIHEIDPRERYFTPWPRTYSLVESLRNLGPVIAIERSAQSRSVTIAGVAAWRGDTRQSNRLGRLPGERAGRGGCQMRSIYSTAREE